MCVMHIAVFSHTILSWHTSAFRVKGLENISLLCSQLGDCYLNTFLNSGAMVMSGSLVIYQPTQASLFSVIDIIRVLYLQCKFNSSGFVMHNIILWNSRPHGYECGWCERYLTWLSLQPPHVIAYDWIYVWLHFVRLLPYLGILFFCCAVHWGTSPSLSTYWSKC
jgi:hypothetical protein